MSVVNRFNVNNTPVALNKDFINVNLENNHETAYSSSTAARNAVPALHRKAGLQITYLLADGWFVDQYVGSDVNGWETTSNWNVRDNNTNMFVFTNNQEVNSIIKEIYIETLPENITELYVSGINREYNNGSKTIWSIGLAADKNAGRDQFAVIRETNIENNDIFVFSTSGIKAYFVVNWNALGVNSHKIYSIHGFSEAKINLQISTNKRFTPFIADYYTRGEYNNHVYIQESPFANSFFKELYIEKESSETEPSTWILTKLAKNYSISDMLLWQIAFNDKEGIEHSYLVKGSSPSIINAKLTNGGILKCVVNWDVLEENRLHKFNNNILLDSFTKEMSPVIFMKEYTNSSVSSLRNSFQLSDNDKLNSIIKELYITGLPEEEITDLQFKNIYCKAEYTNTQFVIRYKTLSNNNWTEEVVFATNIYINTENANKFYIYSYNKNIKLYAIINPNELEIANKDYLANLNKSFVFNIRFSNKLNNLLAGDTFTTINTGFFKELYITGFDAVGSTILLRKDNKKGIRLEDKEGVYHEYYEEADARDFYDVTLTNGGRLYALVDWNKIDFEGTLTHRNWKITSKVHDISYSQHINKYIKDNLQERYDTHIVLNNKSIASIDDNGCIDLKLGNSMRDLVDGAKLGKMNMPDGCRYVWVWMRHYKSSTPTSSDRWGLQAQVSEDSINWGNISPSNIPIEIPSDVIQNEYKDTTFILERDTELKNLSLRDPSLIYYKGVFYSAITISSFEEGLHYSRYGLLKSSNLKDWTVCCLIQPYMNGNKMLPGAPEIEIIDDKVYIIVQLDYYTEKYPEILPCSKECIAEITEEILGYSDGREIDLAHTDLGIGSGFIDGYIMKVGDKYKLLTDKSWQPTLFESDNLLSGYKLVKRFPLSAEGYCIYKVNGIYRINISTGQTFTSPDLENWYNDTSIVNAYRHGSVVSIPIKKVDVDRILNEIL